MIKRVITWRIVSMLSCAGIGRLWFGDWHVTGYGVFLALVMTAMHYAFEKIWEIFVHE